MATFSAHTNTKELAELHHHLQTIEEQTHQLYTLCLRHRLLTSTNATYNRESVSLPYATPSSNVLWYKSAIRSLKAQMNQYRHLLLKAGISFKQSQQILHKRVTKMSTPAQLQLQLGF